MANTRTPRGFVMTEARRLSDAAYREDSIAGLEAHYDKLRTLLPAALARIEELEAAVEEALEASDAFDSLDGRDDNDPDLMAAGVRHVAAQLRLASLLAERKDQP